MKYFICLLTIAFLWAGTTAPAAQTANEEEILSFHFTGIKNIKRSNKGTQLKELLKLPLSLEVQKILIDKLFKTKTISFLGDKPIPNLLDNEIYIQIIGEEKPAFLFAAKIGSSEAQKIFNSLRAKEKNAGTLKTEQNTVNKEETWTRTQDGTTKVLGYGCGWIIYYTYSQDQLPKKLAVNLIHGQQPADKILNNIVLMDLKVPLLSKIFGKSCPLLKNVESISLRAWPEEENIRLSARTLLIEEADMLSQNWNLPTNIITDPLSHLTAIRNSEKIFENMPHWNEIAPQANAPKQLYIYNYDVPFYTILLGSSETAPADVPKMGNGITACLSKYFPEIRNPLQFAVNTNNVEVGWVGWPMLTPTLRAVSDNKQNYLMAGTVAALPKGTPLAPELWNAISKNPKLFFYSWELTGHTLPQWQMLFPLVKMELSKPEPIVRTGRKDLTKGKTAASKNSSPESKVFNWTIAARQYLGNCITRAEQTSPKELLIERNASIGLSSLELWILTEWLSDRL